MVSRLACIPSASVGVISFVALLQLTGCAADRAPPMSPVEAKTNATGTAGNAGYPQSVMASPVSEKTVPNDSSREESFKDAKKSEDVPAFAGPQRVAQAQTTPAPAPPPGPAQPAATPPGAPPKADPAKAEPAKEIAPSRDLVIYTARFSMAVYQVDQGLAAVEKIANDNGGYLGSKKDREITIRIPRGRFQPTLAAIDKIGDVLHRDIQAEDVTDEHVDLEIRIKNSRAMQKRLTDLLTKADVKNALEIEKELHRVTEELERLEGRLKVLKDRIAFSTITVVFEARGATIQATRQRLPFPWLGALNLPSLLSLSEDK